MDNTSLKMQYKALNDDININNLQLECISKLPIVKNYIESNEKYDRFQLQKASRFIQIYERIINNNNILIYRKRKTICNIILNEFLKNHSIILNYDLIDDIFINIIDSNPDIKDKQLVDTFKQELENFVNRNNKKLT